MNKVSTPGGGVAESTSARLSILLNLTECVPF